MYDRYIYIRSETYVHICQADFYILKYLFLRKKNKDEFDRLMVGAWSGAFKGTRLGRGESENAKNGETLEKGF